MKVFSDGKWPVKAWVDGVQLEDEAKKQLHNLSNMPFIHKWVSVMPDCHSGRGSTIGSVIATKNAIIPSCVGVDIGCGMMAVKTSLSANDLPENLHELRSKIESLVPHGRTDNGGKNDRGSWGNVPTMVVQQWDSLKPDFERLISRNPSLAKGHSIAQLGTLGGGNHFIEVCLDENGEVWVMLHSGSRGVGNRIGTLFIEKAKEDMRRYFINLPDEDLSYLVDGTEHFNDYCFAVEWAQKYAKINRVVMMESTLTALSSIIKKPFQSHVEAINCHHNYVTKEQHYGENVWVTRKGAVCARKGMLGIIPGSMGTKSYIVEGLGNKESFDSCSHGAGRTMSRTQAKKQFSVEDHIKATEGVECDKTEATLDETPKAYKDLDLVMEAQKDLVKIVHTLKAVLCVKGT